MSRNEARGGNDRYDTLGNALSRPFEHCDSALKVPEGVRIDGKVCLVTGANRGLGKAVASNTASLPQVRQLLPDGSLQQVEMRILYARQHR